MRAPFWLLLSHAVCLGIVVLTSIVIFLALRRGTQAISQRLKDEDNGASNSDESIETESRWARADLAEKDQPGVIIEMAACPACGGENTVGAVACAYCGRKL